MKFTINRQHFAAALDLCADVAAAKSLNPILGNVLLDVTQKAATVTASNLDLEVCQTVTEVEASSPGRILVNAALLRNIVRECATDLLRIELDHNELLVHSGFDRFELNTAAPSDWPKGQEVKATHAVTVDAAAFVDAARVASGCVASEKGRYALNGVFIKAGKKRLEVVGTDGRRLFRCVLPAACKSPIDDQIILPPRAVGLAARAAMDGEIELRLSADRVAFVGGNTTIITQLVYGQYPTYMDVVPSPADTFSISREGLQRGLSRAKLLTSVESQAVRFEIAKGAVVLRSRSTGAGSGEVKLDIEYAGPPFAIGLDPVYVMRALDAFDSDWVHLAFEKTDSVTIHAGSRDTRQFLVMGIDL